MKSLKKRNEERLKDHRGFSKSFEIYLKNVGKIPFPLIDSKEEQGLIAGIKKGDVSGLDRVVKQHLRLVIFIAGRMAKQYNIQNLDLSLEDLVATGNMKLIEAAKNPDYVQKKGTKFSTYAFRCIQNSIYNLLRKQRRYKEIISLSLDNPLRPEDSKSHTFLNFQEDNSPTLEEARKREKLRRVIKMILKKLPLREAEIICYYFDFNDNGNGGGPLSLRKIGERMNLSGVRVGQLKDKAMKKLRHPVNQRVLKDYLNLLT